MKCRLIILPIDDIARLFKDYAGLTGFPEDAVCDTLLFNKELNKMCLRIQAESLVRDEPWESVDFELKRSWVA
jgi:hypothetical protein